MNKKKLIPIALTGGGILIALFVIMTSYAYWQITKKQNKWNEMVAACLNFELQDNNENNKGISLQSAWPLSDNEGRELDGYTFKVTNNCPTAVNYVIALESLVEEKANYLGYEYIKVAIDDEIESIYADLHTLPNDKVTDGIQIRDTKEVTSATVEGNSYNTHTIRIWIDESTPVSEQSKTFNSRVKITGGQGIQNNIAKATSDECFVIDENTGEITEYKYNEETCGSSVVVPARVNGVEVKSIDTNAFRKTILVSSEVSDWIKENTLVSLVADDTLLTTGAGKAHYFIVYKEGDEANTLITNLYAFASANLGIDYEIPTYVYGKDTVTAEGKPVGELALGQMEAYFEADMDTLGTRTVSEKQKIIVDSVDLSKPIYLETIEASAFSNVPADVTDLSQYNNYDTSLTSLTFGNNIRPINLGINAFANIDVNNLTLYTTYSADGVDRDNNDYSAEAFANAKIDNLVMTKGGDDTILDSAILNGVVANNLEIAEGITEIARGYYTTSEFNNAVITTLTLPTTLTSDIENGLIGQYSIYKSDLSNITNLIINTPITEIKNAAFVSTNLKSVILPETVTKIGYSAFGNSSLQNIKFSSNLVEIGENAFYDADLREINIPSSVETIGTKAFQSNSNLKKLTFENTVENPSQLAIIDEYVFADNGLLQSVTIPSSVTDIKNFAFYNSGSLSSLTFENTESMPSKLEYIGQQSFAESAIRDLIIPSSVQMIEWRSFYRTSNFTEYLKTIVFEDSVDRPANISFIGSDAFYPNNATTITIPSSINKISSKAFYGNSSGAIITVKKAQEDIALLGDVWYGNATVVYDPVE